jgi:hypothetical protein
MIFELDKHSPQIYTTDAFLRPLKIQDVNGKDLWIWYVEGFEGGDSSTMAIFIILKKFHKH